MKRILFGFAIGCFLCIGSSCGSLRNKKAVTSVGTKQFVDSMFTQALEKKFFPGAQIVIGSKDKIRLSATYGFHDYSKKEVVKPDNVYDLASMSKVLGATLVSMRLIGDDKLQLTDQLGNVVPMYKNTPIANLSLFELLTHTTGLKSGITFYQSLLSTTDGLTLLSKEKSEGYPDLFDTMYVNKNIVYDKEYLSFEPKENYIQIYKNMWLNPTFYKIMYEKISQAQTNPRGQYVYSDLNLILIQQMLETVTTQSLDQLTDTLYKQLGISKIGYNPTRWISLEHIMPTEYDSFFRKDTVQGYVHDEAAALLGGVSGNAGLFANANSVAVICQMLLNKGQFQGKQILKAKVIKHFIQSPLAKKGIFRGLGFDKRKPDKTFTSHQYGHTGFTGTFFFIDPKRDLFLVVLTNRVNPTRTNRILYQDDFNPKIWRFLNGRKP